MSGAVQSRHQTGALFFLIIITYCHHCYFSSLIFRHFDFACLQKQWCWIDFGLLCVGMCINAFVCGYVGVCACDSVCACSACESFHTFASVERFTHVLLCVSAMYAIIV